MRVGSIVASPALLGPFAPRLVPGFISQLRPAGAPPGFDGSASCGPTSMTMIARSLGVGRGRSDAELIAWLGRVGGTTLAEGTSLDGLAAMARAIGLGSERRSGVDLAFLDHHLAAGRFVVANGEYYAMPPHEDASKSEGHFVLVYARAGNRYLVHDPADPEVRAVSRSEMRRFLREHHEGGHLVAVDGRQSRPQLMRSA